MNLSERVINLVSKMGSVNEKAAVDWNAIRKRIKADAQSLKRGKPASGLSLEDSNGNEVEFMWTSLPGGKVQLAMYADGDDFSEEYDMSNFEKEAEQFIKDNMTFAKGMSYSVS
jgi:hypothetical protein